MNAPKFWMVIPALLVAGVVGMAYAKLPVAPMDDAAKAAAAEKKAKAAEAAKADRALEEKAMDRAVDRYKREHGIKSAGAAPAKKK